MAHDPTRNLDTEDTSQKGAALIIVLLLVATLSFIVLAMSLRATASIQRTGGVAAREQLLWRAIGLEVLAEGVISEMQAQSGDGEDGATRSAYTLDNPAFNAPITIPIPDGAASIRLTDANRCFNINSLVANGENGLTANEGAVTEFTELAKSIGLGVSEAEGIAQVVIDWIDPDTRRQNGGAEDDFYSALPSPYRTGGGPLADISEMRAMLGVNRDIYAALAPFLCAHPGRAPTKININMLRVQDAPILVAMTGGEIGASQAVDILSNRPPGGWESVTAFWQTPALEALELEEGQQGARTSTTSKYIEVSGQASFNDIDIEVGLIFDTGENGATRLVSREIGHRRDVAESLAPQGDEAGEEN